MCSVADFLTRLRSRTDAGRDGCSSTSRAVTSRSGPRPSISLPAAAGHRLPLQRIGEQVLHCLANGLGRHVGVPAQAGGGPFLFQPLGGRPVGLFCTITSCGTPTQASSSDQLLPAVTAK